MIDVKNKLCKTPLCYTRSQTKYDGYCLYCFVHMFPDRPNAKNYKTKEKSVVDYVIQTFSNYTWISDKMIADGCSRRRPDLLLDLGYQVIIVEIDENQHTDYDCSCENRRLMEISRDLQHRPIIFIRFNPDDYIQSGKKITSCWGTNSTGVCAVKKSKKTEWAARLDALRAQIEYWSGGARTDKTIEVIQLFYNL